MSSEWRPTSVFIDGEQVYCEECGDPVAADRSPGVWVHDPGERGDRAYELNEQHAARPPEGTPHPDEWSR